DLSWYFAKLSFRRRIDPEFTDDLKIRNAGDANTLTPPLAIYAYGCTGNAKDSKISIKGINTDLVTLTLLSDARAPAVNAITVEGNTLALPPDATVDLRCLIWPIS